MSENQNISSAEKPRVKSLLWETFGRLFVEEEIPSEGWSPLCVCSCSCGKQVTVARANLLRKKRPTISCGCVGKERAKVINQARLTSHGKRFTRTYRCWANMKTRATNPNSGVADRYMLRGIGICDKWLTFENFLADMGECPSAKHSIDRIENDWGYFHGNCRWATNDEQQRNKSDNHRVTYKGVTCCLTEMAERHGINPIVFQARITQRGWSVEEAVETPVRVK